MYELSKNTVIIVSKAGIVKKLRIRLKKALSASFGAWKDKDHPELIEGTDAYVRSLRKSSRLSLVTGVHK